MKLPLPAAGCTHLPENAEDPFFGGIGLLIKHVKETVSLPPDAIMWETIVTERPTVFLWVK